MTNRGPDARDAWLTAKFVLDRRFIDDGLDGKDRP